MSWKTFLPKVLPDSNLETYKAIADLKKKIYPSYFAQTRIYQHVFDFLSLSKNFAPIGLVTTASRSAVQQLLAYHKINNLFDVVITGDDVVNSKPNAEPYLLAANRLKVDITKCIVLEDSNVGIEAAIASTAKVFIVKHEQ